MIDGKHLLRLLKSCPVITFMLYINIFIEILDFLYFLHYSALVRSSCCVLLSVEEPFRFQTVFHYLGYLTSTIYNK